MYFWWLCNLCVVACGKCISPSHALSFLFVFLVLRQCLAEVAGLVDPKYDAVFTQMYVAFLTQLVTIMPPTTDIKAAYPRSRPEDQAFFQRLCLFFTVFFKSHLPLLEQAVMNGSMVKGALLTGMAYLVKLSDVDETEVFKIALEFWQHFSNQLFSSERSFAPRMAGTPVRCVVVCVCLSVSVSVCVRVRVSVCVCVCVFR